MSAVMVAEQSAPTRTAVIVELIGPAGCGKSTLSRALRREWAGSSKGPELWGQSRRLLAQSALLLTPVMIRAGFASRSFAPELLGQMIRTEALTATLKDSRGADGLTVIDEGALFALAWMDVFFPRWNWRYAEEWRAQTIERWAGALDAVVRLDASDTTLAERIRARDKAHAVKNLSDAEIRRFSESFRLAFDAVIDDLTSARRIPVIEVRTDDPDFDCVASVHGALRGVPAHA